MRQSSLVSIRTAKCTWQRLSQAVLEDRSDISKSQQRPRGPTTASAELDWLAPHLDVDAMAPGTDGPWLDFWFGEVDPRRMHTSALSILLEKQQHHHQVSPGNMIDCIHSAYLNLADRVVTCDVKFYKVMEEVARRSRVRGILLDRSAPSAVAELWRTVGTAASSGPPGRPEPEEFNRGARSTNRGSFTARSTWPSGLPG